MNLSNMKDLLKIKTYVDLQSHYVILGFYMFVVFITSTIGHVLDKKDGFTYGMIVGFVVSLVLWFQYGKKMAY
jgi:hypothetical protein